jgi:hypothetical protein
LQIVALEIKHSQVAMLFAKLMISAKHMTYQPTTQLTQVNAVFFRMETRAMGKEASGATSRRKIH